jgi:hypothetical protein
MTKYSMVPLWPRDAALSVACKYHPDYSSWFSPSLVAAIVQAAQVLPDMWERLGGTYASPDVLFNPVVRRKRWWNPEYRFRLT